MLVTVLWLEDDPRAVGGTKRGLHEPSGKGGMIIILHAGGKNGWIALVSQSKKAMVIS